MEIRADKCEMLKGKGIGDVVDIPMVIKGIQKRRDYSDAPIIAKDADEESKKKPKEYIFYDLEYSEKKPEKDQSWFDDNKRGELYTK
jgi:precorrin isomerase